MLEQAAASAGSIDNEAEWAVRATVAVELYERFIAVVMQSAYRGVRADVDIALLKRVEEHLEQGCAMYCQAVQSSAKHLVVDIQYLFPIGHRQADHAIDPRTQRVQIVQQSEFRKDGKAGWLHDDARAYRPRGFELLEDRDPVAHLVKDECR